MPKRNDIRYGCTRFTHLGRRMKDRCIVLCSIRMTGGANQPHSAR